MSETPDEVMEEAAGKSATEQAPAPAPERPKPARRSKLASIRLYQDQDGYRFIGVTKAGKPIEDTRSNFSYLTVQHAKRAAHAVHPTLSIR